MAPVYILALTVLVLAVLRKLLVHEREKFIDPFQMTAALVLPLLGFFGVNYIFFAAGVILLIMVAPGATRGGLMFATPTALHLRARLMIFCLPIMPALTYTLATSGLTIVQLTYMNLVMIGYGAALLKAGRQAWRRPLDSWDACFLVMLLTQGFMDARGDDFTYMLRASLQVCLNVALPYLVVSQAFRNSRSPVDLLTPLIAAACLLAAIALFEMLRHWLVYDSMPYMIGADPEGGTGYAKLRGGWLRGKATYGESTGLSLFLGCAAIMLFALRNRLGIKRWKLLVVALILGGGIVAALARIGYMVVAIGIPLCLLYERNWRTFARLAVIFPIAGGALYLLAKISPLVAASTGLSGEASGSVDYRSMMFNAGMQIITGYPLTGLSMAEIYARLDYLKQGEGIVDLINLPLTVFMRAGIVGGLLYFLPFFAVLASLLLRRRELDRDGRAAAAACFATLVAMMCGLFTTSFGRNETIYLLLLSAGAGLLSRASMAAVLPGQHHISGPVRNKRSPRQAPESTPIPLRRT